MQWSTKRKDIAFPDDHVRMVGFPPGFTGYCEAIFQATGSYSNVVALSKISGYVLSAQHNCKARADGCCEYVATLLYNILDSVELGLAIIPEDKTCTDTHNTGISQEISQVIVQFFFPKYSFVHHSYGERKAEVAAARLDEYKKY